MNRFTKKPILWLLSCGLLVLGACRKTAVQSTSNQITYTTVGSDRLALVPINLARQVAMYRPKDSPAINLQENLAGATPRSIKSEYTYSGKDGYPNFYVFNYTDGGFVLISADLKVQPVMAFVPKGAWDSRSMPDGVSFWVNKNMQFIDGMREKNPPIGNYVSRLWSHVLPGIQMPSSPPVGKGGVTTLKNPGSNPCQFQAWENYYGPLLVTAWGQGCGYNGDCPYDPSGSCSFDLTGCVATAMAQVAYYWQRPALYNYGSMPTNMIGGQVNSPALQQLMANMGADVNMNYGPAESSIPLAASGNIATAFTADMGYATAAYVANSPSFTDITGNINAGRPIILLGVDPARGGHCWVCDGYSVIYNQLVDCSITSMFAYMHMNWGWGEAGTSNTYIGWYQTFAAAGFNFTDDLGEIVNIHP